MKLFSPITLGLIVWLLLAVFWFGGPTIGGGITILTALSVYMVYREGGPSSPG